MPWENIFTVSSRRPHGGPCLASPLSRLLSRWPGRGADRAVAGGPHPQPPWRPGPLLPELDTFLHSVLGTLSPKGYKLKCLPGQTGNVCDQQEAVGTSGACGTSKSKCPSHWAQSRPMAATQEGWRPSPKKPSVWIQMLTLFMTSPVASEFTLHSCCCVLLFGGPARHTPAPGHLHWLAARGPSSPSVAAGSR